jgi:uncharacterized radical SAM superfamily protein
LVEPGALFANRLKTFGRTLECYLPSFKRYNLDWFNNRGSKAFQAVSLTGSQCAVNCEHCKGIILQSMLPALTPEDLWELGKQAKASGAKGFLVSGGSRPDYTVPFEPFCEVISRLTGELGLSIAVHTSRTSPQTARRLAEAGVKIAMVDLVGDERTAKEILHLPSASLLWEALDNLIAAGLKVNPHIIMGLYWGSFKGEYAALEQAAQRKLHALVLVGLRALHNTPMAKVKPPPLVEFVEFMQEARRKFATTPVILGCARPAGPIEYELEQAAVACGLNGVAFPSESTIEYARRLGLEPHAVESCCAVPLVE